MGQFTYTTLPVPVEAVNSDILDEFCAGTNTVQVPWWVVQALASGALRWEPKESGVYGRVCATKNGTCIITPGAWLIKPQDGELYPCCDATFKQRHQKVEA